MNFRRVMIYPILYPINTWQNLKAITAQEMKLKYSEQYLYETDLSSCSLQFRYDRRNTLLKMSRLALWILSAPAASSNSERSFSAVGNTVTHPRNPMSPITVEKSLFFKSNYDLLTM